MISGLVFWFWYLEFGVWGFRILEFGISFIGFQAWDLEFVNLGFDFGSLGVLVCDLVL